MSFDRSNTNTGPTADCDPDAHGQAAVLLVESLIHGLIARDVITVADAVEIVDLAIEVNADEASGRSLQPHNLRKSQQLLEAIGNSLSRDVL